MLARLFGLRIQGVYGLEEIVKLLTSVAALSFFPLCHLRGGHIAVDILVNTLPRAVQQVNDLLVQVLAVFGALFLAWWIVAGTLEVWEDRTVSGILAWPQWPFYIPGVISMLLWAMVAALRASDILHDMRGASYGSS
jgi:TRAP-type C4-dicarboxylate transport system permease small subunit